MPYPQKEKEGYYKTFFFLSQCRGKLQILFSPLLCIAHFKSGPLVGFGGELLLDFADEPKNWRLAKTKNEMSLILHIPFRGRIITKAFYNSSEQKGAAPLKVLYNSECIVIYDPSSVRLNVHVRLEVSLKFHERREK